MGDPGYCDRHICYFDLHREASLGDGTQVVFGDGDQIQVATETGPQGSVGVCFLLISGKPIHELVACYGPIVMNTEEELRTAYREPCEGFLSKPGVYFPCVAPVMR